MVPAPISETSAMRVSSSVSKISASACKASRGTNVTSPRPMAVRSWIGGGRRRAAPANRPVPDCRGHGWLNVRSGPVYRPAALKITGAPLPRAAR